MHHDPTDYKFLSSQERNQYAHAMAEALKMRWKRTEALKAVKIHERALRDAEAQRLNNQANPAAHNPRTTFASNNSEDPEWMLEGIREELTDGCLSYTFSRRSSQNTSQSVKEFLYLKGMAVKNEREIDLLERQPFERIDSSGKP